MGPWSLLLWTGTLCVSLSSMGCAGGSLGIRQRSVDSCGPHPLIALAAASRPFGNSGSSLNDLLRAVRGDPGSWSEMQILLRRYDDCIRAGDGLHYKRSPNLGQDKYQTEFQQFTFPTMSHSPRSVPEETVVGSLPEF